MSRQVDGSSDHEKIFNSALIRQRLIQLAAAAVLTGVLLSGYWIIQRTIEPVYDFAIALDYQIPFWPWTIWIYLSDIVFFSIVAVLIDRTTFIRMLTVLIIAYIFCMAGFILLPSAYPRLDISGIDSDFYRWGYGIFHGVDYANNTFPSMHIALTWIACLELAGRYRRWVVPIMIYCLAVTFSVLTTKQHFILDIIGGVAVVGAAYAIHSFARYIIGRRSFPAD